VIQLFFDRGLRCFGSLGSFVCFDFFGAGFLVGTSVCDFRFSKHRLFTVALVGLRILSINIRVDILF
jgi:hypothetical protein